MKKYSYPNLYVRKFRSRGGRTRVLFYCRFTDWTGKRRLFACGDDFERAKRKRDDYLRLNDQQHDFDEQHHAVLLRDWAEQWLTLTATKRSHVRDAMVVRRHLIPAFGDVIPGEITELQVETYKRQREQETTRFGTPPAPATINRELSALRSILIMVHNARRLLDRKGVLVPRPKIRLLKEPPRRDRVITWEEYQALKQRLPAPYSAIITVLWELGARETETCFLQRSSVDLVRETLTFTQVKTDPRTVPLNTVLIQTLAPYVQGEGEDDRLFSGATKDKFWWHFKRARRATGLADVWPHDFRASFITRMIDAGFNPKTVALITGSKDMRVLMRHYDRPSFASMRAVIGNTVATQPVLSPDSPAENPQMQ